MVDWKYCYPVVPDNFGMDPWQNVTIQSETNTCEPYMNFEDNFEPKNTDSRPNLQGLHLPDSSEYLARLEQKLTKLKNGKDSAKSLVESLSAARQSCMIQLLSDEESIPQEIEEEICIGRTQELILRHLAPQKQAISIDELVELLKADHLAHEEDKES